MEVKVDIEPPRPRRDRIFFALKPTPDVAPVIAELARALQRRHGWPETGKVANERLHVTLHHLGDHAGVPEDVVARAERAARSVEAAPFDVSFDRILTFSSRGAKRPVVLGASPDDTPVCRFQRRLGREMRVHGLAPAPDARFRPHITLHYVARAVPEEGVPTVSWRVGEFVLIHSLLGRGEHRILGRWSL